MRALAIAATGMSAQEQNLKVIANNIANINTTGFKRSRAEFTDLIYQSERLMGVSSRGRDATVPEGAQIGLGVRTAAIRSVQIQGALTSTGNSLRRYAPPGPRSSCPATTVRSTANCMQAGTAWR